jgi:hypothetical protein
VGEENLGAATMLRKTLQHVGNVCNAGVYDCASSTWLYQDGVTAAQLKLLEYELGVIEGTILDDWAFDLVTEAIQADLGALLVKVATARIRAESRERELKKPVNSASPNGERSAKQL